jgi:3-methylcrotonyl-CoA carboxylase alpha subunit
MEMNTRLQVEHPVTEMITGQDLVEWQLRVAAGQRLPLLQDELAIHGHSVEARVYAENPDKGFLPSTGQLRYLATPEAAHFAVGAAAGEPAGVRIDSGIREGDAISPFYDPMIAKLITWGRDRAEAIARMDQALAEFDVVGPATNVAFLKRLMRSPAFSGADLDTGLIEREREVLLPPAATPTPTVLAIAAAAVLSIEDEAAARAAPAGSADPWAQRTGWRPCGWQSRPMGFRRGDAQFPVVLSHARRGYSVQVGDETVCLSDLSWDPVTRRLGGLVGSEAFEARAVLEGETLHLFGPSGPQQLGYAPPLAHAGDDAAEGGNLTAPMPGKVVALLCAQGDRVSKGQPLLVMEAMKMEHTINAPADGEVTGLPFAVGDQVAEGAQLIGFAAA